MKTGLTAIGISAVAIALIVILSNFDYSKGRMYDCGMAEWHPDIPNEVRDECRKRKLEEYRRQEHQRGVKITT